MKKRIKCDSNVQKEGIGFVLWNWKGIVHYEQLSLNRATDLDLAR